MPTDRRSFQSRLTAPKMAKELWMIVGTKLGNLFRVAMSLSLVASLAISQSATGQSMMGNNIPNGSPLGVTGNSGAMQGSSQSQSQGAANSNAGLLTDNQTIQPVSIAGGLTENTILGTGADAETPPRLKPPAPPGEYEEWVRSVTGRKVKRFGSDLLLPSNRDYVVPAASSVPPDYALNIGDVVSISTTGSVEGSANFQINKDGRIYLPHVGSIDLVGVRFRDLKDRVFAAIGNKYRGYDVFVSIAKLRGVRVYVTGFANDPGAYTVNSLSTLVNAILAAGGPSAGGSFRSVKLYRNGREVVDFDLYDLIRKGDKSRDPLLQNDDVLFISPVGRQVAVIGSVNEEAIYEARPGESVADMVRLAGGPTNLADPSRFVLYRLTDQKTVGSRQLAADQASLNRVDAGDIIQVLQQGTLQHPLERQQVIVRIEGEVDRPGNYYVPPNTPLSMVLQMAGGLTPRAFVYGTQFSRVSVAAQQRVSFREAIDQMESTLAAAPLSADRTIDASERQAQLASARAYLDKLRQAEPDGRLVLPLTPEMSNLPGNMLLENNDRIVVPPRVDTVGVFGAVYRPASFLIDRSGSLRVHDYIEQAGGPIRAADRANIFVVHASGAVITAKRGALASRILPGDVIFVPIKTQSSSLLAKIKDISAIVFQLGLSVAAVAALQ